MVRRLQAELLQTTVERDLARADLEARKDSKPMGELQRLQARMYGMAEERGRMVEPPAAGTRTTVATGSAAVGGSAARWPAQTAGHVLSGGPGMLLRPTLDKDTFATADQLHPFGGTAQGTQAHCSFSSLGGRSTAVAMQAPDCAAEATTQVCACDAWMAG